MSKILKEKWKNVRAAKKAKKIAESEIVETSTERPDNVCIFNEIQRIPDRLKDKEFPAPMIIVRHCEHFSEGQICDNADCPMHDKNVQYISALKKHKQERREFFHMLFHGRKR